MMTRFLFVIPLVLIASRPRHSSRGTMPARATWRAFAAPIMNDGDQVVLACLQAKPRRLSKACDKF